MSVFARCFKWTSNAEPHTLLRLPIDLKDELLAAAVLLPLAEADLRSPISTKVTCSDATPQGCGVVASEVSAQCAEALFRHCEHKGAYTRLDWGPAEWQLEPWEGQELPQVLRDVVASAPWHAVREYDFSNIDHVNLQEARATKAVLLWHLEQNLDSEIILNGTDSRVGLGSWAKGRSSAGRLNSIWRECLSLCIFGRKRLLQFWLSTHENPADEPSRHKPVRQPKQVVSSVVSNLITPQRTPHKLSKKGPCRDKFFCLEVFAGMGMLTKALEAQGLGVGIPMEAFPSGSVYVPLHDLSDSAVVSHLFHNISQGVYYYVHFGLPCSSWSILQSLFNDGTRTRERPEGTQELEREILGNKLAKSVARLCNALHRANCFYSIENPRSSYVWEFEPIKGLLRHSFDVQFDQCEYNLIPIHMPSQSTYRIKKPTTLRTNMIALKSLARKCRGDHKHFRCCGSVKTPQGWVSVAKAAGAYPPSLCKQWATCVASSCRSCV